MNASTLLGWLAMTASALLILGGVYLALVWLLTLDAP